MLLHGLQSKYVHGTTPAGWRSASLKGHGETKAGPLRASVSCKYIYTLWNKDICPNASCREAVHSLQHMTQNMILLLYRSTETVKASLLITNTHTAAVRHRKVQLTDAFRGSENTKTHGNTRMLQELHQTNQIELVL